MTTDNFDSMIKQYTDELMKMNSEKSLPDIKEEKSIPLSEPEKTDATENEEAYEEAEAEADAAVESTERKTTDDIPGIKNTPFYLSEGEKTDTLTGEARFSARVFTGNNAYPIEDAKVLVIRDGRLFTYLVTDRNGKTKTIDLPAFPEKNTLDIKNDEQYINYTGEVYATGFTPKKNLLITATGGSDIVLDVQMTPLSERVK